MIFQTWSFHVSFQLINGFLVTWSNEPVIIIGLSKTVSCNTVIVSCKLCCCWHAEEWNCYLIEGIFPIPPLSSLCLEPSHYAYQNKTPISQTTLNKLKPGFLPALKRQTGFYITKVSRAVGLYSVWICIFTMKVFPHFWALVWLWMWVKICGCGLGESEDWCVLTCGMLWKFYRMVLIGQIKRLSWQTTCFVMMSFQPCGPCYLKWSFIYSTILKLEYFKEKPLCKTCSLETPIIFKLYHTHKHQQRIVTRGATEFRNRDWRNRNFSVMARDELDSRVCESLLLPDNVFLLWTDRQRKKDRLATAGRGRGEKNPCTARRRARAAHSGNV